MIWGAIIANGYSVDDLAQLKINFLCRTRLAYEVSHEWVKTGLLHPKLN
jgi:hypothetical protein